MFATKRHFDEYLPAVIDSTDVPATLDGARYTLSLWDTAGKEDCDRLRPLSCPQTDCFLACFSSTSMSSLDSLCWK